MERTNIFQSIKNAIWNAAYSEEISLPEYRYEPTTHGEIYSTDSFDDALGMLAIIRDCIHDYWDEEQDGMVKVDTIFKVGKFSILVAEWEDAWEDEL